MNPSTEPRTSPANGRLWGARARDWADVQEGQCSAAYQTVFDSLSLQPGTKYCDAGCGSGMAALHASHRGAEVSYQLAFNKLDMMLFHELQGVVDEGLDCGRQAHHCATG
jgi:hypothetical protein